MLVVGTSVVFDELPETVRVSALTSTSPIVNVSALVAVSSSIVWLAMSVMVGASLTAFTVNVKVSLALAVPSPTVTVIVADPF